MEMLGLPIEFEDIDQALQKAIEYRRNGDFSNAISVYQKLIQLQPRNSVFYDRTAQVQAQKGNFAEAIDNYRQAISLGIENPVWTYKNLGDALREESKLEEAELTYSEAIKVNSSNAFVYDCLGQVQAQQEKFSEAIDNYRQAISLGIENPTWTYKNLENALREENRIEEAESVHEELLKVQSKKSIISNSPQLQPEKSLDTNTDVDNRWLKLHDRGDNCFKQQKWEDAITFYQQAIEVNSGYFWSHYNMGKALFELERWNSAIKSYKRAIELEPDNIQVRDSLIHAQSLQSNNHKSLPSKTEKSTNHDFLLACIKLGDNYFDIRQLEKAKESYELAISLNPNVHNHIYQKLETILVELNRHESQDKKEIYQKLTKYRDSVEDKSEKAEISCKIGKILVELGKLSEALEEYEEAIQCKPENHTAYYLLADVFKQNEPKKAISYYKKSIDLEPSYLPAYYQLLNLDSQSADIYLKLAHTLAQQSRYYGAIIIYKLILRLFPDSSQVMEAYEHYQKYIDRV